MVPLAPGVVVEVPLRVHERTSRSEAVADLNKLYGLVADNRTVTLVYASRDEQHNNAVVLRDLINGVRKPPSSSGPMKAAAAPKRARARR